MTKKIDAPAAAVRCSMCGNTNVEVSMPAWCDPNANWYVIEVDLEAYPLSTWCRDCCTDTTLKTDEGGIITGDR